MSRPVPGDADLQRRAVDAGLHPHWTDVSGIERTVSQEVLGAVLATLRGGAEQGAADAPLLTTVCGQPLVIPGAGDAAALWRAESGEEQPALRDSRGRWGAPLQPGYYAWLQGGRQQRVAVSPAQAWFPHTDASVRPWGAALQVQGLRGQDDGGIGDSTGALAWGRALRLHGATAMALSPIHASMPITDAYSPYSPSDRRWLEPVHASPVQVLAEAAAAVRHADPVLDQALARHEAATLIDWPAAAAAKWQWIGRLPAWLQTHQPAQWQPIEAGMQALGDDLLQWSQHTAALSRAPASLLAFGQWLAQESWRQAQQQVRGEGMQIGLIADLAVGFDPSGIEALANADAVLRGLELGAPPDAFNPHGQAWGITGYSPLALRAQGYAPFIRLLRAVMAERGGVRIDHILGLRRLWVVPRGAGAGQGVYLDQPFDDLLNLLVLESWRHRCLVIGEDLGVVPPGIRDALASRGVLGLDVLAFSRDEKGVWPPARWRETAVAMTSTHDLPPLAGWLRGADLAWRQRLGWNDESATRIARQQRQCEVQQLAERVADEGLDSGDLQRDALALTARSPARLALLPLEDALGLEEQPNLPGTTSEHPNWRRRVPLHLDESAVSARLAAFAGQRGKESNP